MKILSMKDMIKIGILRAEIIFRKYIKCNANIMSLELFKIYELEVDIVWC